MALQLDVESAGEEVAETLQQSAGRIDASLVALGELAGEGSLVAAGQAVEAAGVLGQQVPGDPRLALGPAAGGGGGQPAEVAVARLAGGEQGEPRLGVDASPFDAGFRVRHQADGTEARPLLEEAGLVRQRHLGSDQGLDPRLLRRLVKARRGVDAVGVHQGHGRQLQRRRPVDQILGERGAVEEREGGGGVELGVRWGRPPGHRRRIGINQA